MTQWDGKSRGTPLGYRIFVWMLKHLGRSPAYFVLNFVAAYFLLFSGKSTKFIRQYYKTAFQHSTIQSIGSAYRNYVAFGKIIIDKLALLSGFQKTFTYEYDGEERLFAMQDSGKGGLLLSAHMGSWEIAGQLLNRLTVPVSIVMYDGEDEQIKEYINNVTGGRSFSIIYVKPDLSHLFQIYKVVNEGGFVCMHADRYRPETKTIGGNFMGKEALFPEGPFLLAVKFKIPTAFVFAFKEGHSHYHFYTILSKEFHAEEGVGPSDVLSSYIDTLEMLAKRYPYQWFNYFDFWKNGTAH